MNDKIIIPKATSNIIISTPVLRLMQRTSSQPDTNVINVTSLDDQNKLLSSTSRDLPSLVRNKPMKKRILILSEQLLQSHHIDKSDEDGAGGKKKGKMVSCPQCHKKMKPKSLKPHMKTHLGLKQFKCDLCGDGFTRKNDVKRHKKLIHEKQRNIQCTICKKYFLSEEKLESHNIFHKAKLVCKICGLKFSKLELYKNHLNFIHPEDKQEMNDCNKLHEKDNVDKSNKSSVKNKIIVLGCPENNTLTNYTKQSKIESDMTEKEIENIGQLVQKEDGTFDLVGARVDLEKEEDLENVDEVTPDSQDAVQTLINAVQQLIQTHEETESKKNKDE